MKRHLATATALAALLIAAPAAVLAQSPDPGVSPDPNAQEMNFASRTRNRVARPSALCEQSGE